ncbi:craniofacial development protein 2-like [Plakobranchus ocellatus]|uniref:Craniofacial development protein 2-like n=1 Tax=Plakobranchus ocellatus TaxID=259542 RepID=A0AAV3ZK25_9GAST|nr:craniofacial development protein 2-like [Plakobranchus ocellatus]
MISDFQGAGDGARTRDKRVSAVLRADSIPAVSPTPLGQVDLCYLFPSHFLNKRPRNNVTLKRKIVQCHNCYGVIFFDVTTAKSLGSWCPISDRVVVPILVAKPLNLGIVQVYAPTPDSEDVEVEKFCEEIEGAKGHLKSQYIKIIMGDFNATVGDQRAEDVVGPSGIGTVNERGSRLIECCQINDFTITNTWYQNQLRRQWTWKSPGDGSRNKIDYILIQKRFRNAVKTSKSLPGADCV